MNARVELIGEAVVSVLMLALYAFVVLACMSFVVSAPGGWTKFWVALGAAIIIGGLGYIMWTGFRIRRDLR